MFLWDYPMIFYKGYFFKNLWERNLHNLENEYNFKGRLKIIYMKFSLPTNKSVLRK